MDLRSINRRLEQIRDECIYESAEDRAKRQEREQAEAKRLAEMSPLERFAYQTTKEINELQARQMEYNEKMQEQSYASTRDAVASRNEMNRMKMSIRQKADRIPGAKTEDERKQRDSLRKVLDKIKRQDRAAIPSAGGSNLYGDLDGNNADPLLGGGAAAARGSGVQQWDGESDLGGGGANYEPIALDQEFQTLFSNFQKTDEEIDRMLDVTAAGLMTLNNQAKLMSQELKTQGAMLESVDQKMNQNIDQLKGLNKKLKKTIKEVSKSNICLYVICCVLLVALGGVIYFTMSDSGRKHKN